jgi:hypothetical protein
MAKKLIQDYNSFGEWGQDRGGNVLDAISNILGGTQNVMKYKKGKEQEDIMRQALGAYAQEQGVSDYVKPEMVKGFDEAIKPMEYNPNSKVGLYEEGSMAENPIESTSQEVFTRMSPEQQMQALAMMRMDKGQEGGAGKGEDPVKWMNAIIGAESLMKGATAEEKARVTSARNLLEDEAKGRFPGYGRQLSVERPKEKANVRTQQIESLKLDKKVMKAFGKSGQQNFEAWAVQQGLLQ